MARAKRHDQEITQGNNDVNKESIQYRVVEEQYRRSKVEKETVMLPPGCHIRQPASAVRSPSAAQKVFQKAELVRLICQFVAPSEPGSGEQSWDPKSALPIPEVSRQWTSLLVPLVQVNKLFWRSATDILWNRMDGVEPFFEILQPNSRRRTGRNCFQKFGAMITSSQWRRFDLYSRKARTLIFSPSSPKMSPAWASFLAVAKPPDIKWFPGVKRIFLHPDELLRISVPAFVTITTAHQLEMLQVGGVAANSGEMEPILCSFTLVNPKLNRLEFTQSLSLSALLHLHELRSLTFLRLALPPKVEVHHLRSSIAYMTALTTLEIHRAGTEPTPRRRGKPSPLATEEDVNNALCRSAYPESLQILSVDADVMVQDMVAAALSPRSLSSLHITLHSSDVARIRPSLSVHRQRNAGLISLSLRVVEVASAQNEDDAREYGRSQGEACVRGEVNLGIDTIFEEIGLLQNLRKLLIVGVPIAKRSMVAKDFAKTVLPNLKLLEELTFLPRALQRAKKLHLSSLKSLVEISKNNQKLTDLNMGFRLPKDPLEIPPDYASTHRLRVLKIRGSPRRGDTGEELGAVIDIARFLDRVFPHLCQVSVELPESEQASPLWSQIQGLVLMNQEMRAERVKREGRGSRVAKDEKLN